MKGKREKRRGKREKENRTYTGSECVIIITKKT